VYPLFNVSVCKRLIGCPFTMSQVANVNWLNVTQGLYVCANGGQCVAPDVCACAEGWIG
jgi:hypothetical protein